MYSTQAWAAHYGLPLNTPDEFVQGYVDAMRMDAKGQGKPCGRGFIAPGKKCGTKGRQQLASDLRAGDAGAKKRVATGKQNAMAQQAARRAARPKPPVEETPPPQPKAKRPKSNVDRFGRTPKQQYKQAKSKVRELKMRGMKGAPVREAEAEVKRLEKKFNPMVPRRKRTPEAIAKGKATRAKNRAAAEKARKRPGQGFDLEG
jgi:hypothetical protein